MAIQQSSVPEKAGAGAWRRQSRGGHGRDELVGSLFFCPCWQWADLGSPGSTEDLGRQKPWPEWLKLQVPGSLQMGVYFQAFWSSFVREVGGHRPQKLGWAHSWRDLL